MDPDMDTLFINTVIRHHISYWFEESHNRRIKVIYFLTLENWAIVSNSSYLSIFAYFVIGLTYFTLLNGWKVD